VLDVGAAERLAFGVGAENAARLHPRLGSAVSPRPRRRSPR
jgi:hypothetical protein